MITTAALAAAPFTGLPFHTQLPMHSTSRIVPQARSGIAPPLIAAVTSRRVALRSTASSRRSSSGA